MPSRAPLTPSRCPTLCPTLWWPPWPARDRPRPPTAGGGRGGGKGAGEGRGAAPAPASPPGAPQCSGLPQNYLTKARTADQVHNGTAEGTVGPVEQKLVSLGEVRGIVAGNFGEVS